MHTYNMSQAARKLNIGLGRNTIFEILIEKGIINKSHVPMQEFIDAEYLIPKYKIIERGSKRIPCTVLHVSVTGIDWLRNTLLKYKADRKEQTPG